MPTPLHIASVALLGVAAAAALSAGDRSPAWVERLGGLAGLDPEASMRALAGILVAFALAILAIPTWRPRVSRAGVALVTLVAIATVSGAIRGPLVTALAAAGLAALGAALFVALTRRADEPRRPSRASGAWRILGGVACATVALAAAAAAPVRARPADEEVAPHRRGVDALSGAVDLMVNRWEGRPLSETGLFTHIPALRPLIGDGTTYLVFYNTRCGHCHQFFLDHFSQPPDGPAAPSVIAIEIPEAPGERSLPSDQPEDIECPSCVRMRLPTGPVWVISPPTVVRVEGGIVTCANEPPQRKSCVE